MARFIVFIVILLLPNKSTGQISLVGSGQTSLVGSQSCGTVINTVVAFLVGGNVTTAAERPWHALLELKKKQNQGRIVAHCGATVLAPRVLLTAAHCLWANHINFRREELCPEEIRNDFTTSEECHDRPGGCPDGCLRVRPQDLNVYVGISDIRQKDRTPLQIENIVIHEGWRKNISIRENLQLGHDIAILILQNPLTFSRRTQPICLPDDSLDLVPGLTATINGFGSIRYGFDKTPARRLQSGSLQLMTKEDCHGIEGDQVCAGSDVVDSCRGDSGGGLTTVLHGGQRGLTTALHDGQGDEDGLTTVLHGGQGGEDGPTTALHDGQGGEDGLTTALHDGQGGEDGLTTVLDRSPGHAYVNVIIGVTSSGSGSCGSRPGVYTNVKTHKRWILKIIKQFCLGPIAETYGACSPSETCLQRRCCSYVQAKYEERRSLGESAADREKSSAIRDLLRAAICNKRQRAFCCPK